MTEHELNTDNFPLVRTMPLGEPARQMKFLRRRHSSDLPPALPHHTWVLNVNGQLQVHKPQQFTGREAEMVNATSLSVVDMSHRLLPVQIELPSNDPGEGFVLRVQFACQVSNPAEVVAQSLSDVGQLLQAQLQSYPVVTQLAAEYAPDEIDRVRQVAVATIEAVKAHSPLAAPGMEVRLTGCDVFASGDVREHARAVTKEHRKHSLDTLRTQNEELLALVRAQERKRVVDEVLRQREEIRSRGQYAEEDADLATLAAESSPAVAAERRMEERRRREERALDWDREDREHQRRIEQRDFDYRVVREDREYERRRQIIEAIAKAGVLRELTPRAFNNMIESLGLDPVTLRQALPESRLDSADDNPETHVAEDAGRESDLPDPEAWGR